MLAFRATTDPEQDPAVQLEQLARRQSDVLAQRFGEDSGREIPTRSLPYGSEGVVSPSYESQAPSGGTASSAASASASASASAPLATLQPSYKGPSPSFERDETFPSQSTPEPATEEELDVLQT